MGNLCSSESVQPAQIKSVFNCANHKVPCTQKHIMCTSHSLCLSCEYQSILKKACIYCLRSLNKFELEYKNKIENSCFLCNSPNTSKLICDCFLCSNCIKTISSEYTCPRCGKVPKQKYSCVVCTIECKGQEIVTFGCDHYFCKACVSFFPLLDTCPKCANVKKQIKKNYPCTVCTSEYTRDKMLNFGCEHYFCQACKKSFSLLDYCPSCIKVPKQTIKIYPCIVCTREFTRDQMLTLDCDHYFCQACIEYHIKVNIHEYVRELRTKKGISCFNCQTIIDFHIIQSVLSSEDFEKYNRILIEANECPNCKLPYFTDVKNVFCSRCKYYFCNSCLRADDKCQCDNEEVIAGDDMSACPGCRIPYLKDEGCNHVKCIKPGCGEEFCFQCSAVRSPTLMHGCHYHRPQCKFYSQYKGGDDKFSKNCKMCVKAGKLCNPPKNLKIPRRINKDEI